MPTKYGCNQRHTVKYRGGPCSGLAIELGIRLKSIVAVATIHIMKLAWVTYLGALSRINAILIPRISAHPPILPQCKVHRPWALFREGTVLHYYR